jgi:hypothetical protein
MDVSATHTVDAGREVVLNAWIDLRGGKVDELDGGVAGTRSEPSVSARIVVAPGYWESRSRDET